MIACPTCGALPVLPGVGFGQGPSARPFGAIAWPDPWTINDLASLAMVILLAFSIYDRSHGRRNAGD